MAINPYTIIGSALAGHLGTALGTALPVYRGIAPQGARPPYGIYAPLSGVEEYTWDSEEVQTQYQIKIVSEAKADGEAIRLYGQLHAVVQDAPLSVGGGVSLLCCRRSGLIPSYQDSKNYWHVGGIYRIDIIGEV